MLSMETYGMKRTLMGFPLNLLYINAVLFFKRQLVSVNTAMSSNSYQDTSNQPNTAKKIALI